MIVFVVARGYARTHKHVSEAARGRTDIRVRSYQELCTLGSADKATYVFTDMDRLAGPNLLAAGLLYRRLKAADIRVLNDPARIPSRSGLLRRLAKRGINDFNAYRLEEERDPERWPVFLRCIGGHN